MDDKDRNVIPGRTPDVIAAEITVIQDQIKKYMLVSAVEIGRRLLEAKEMVPYGEFVTWLKDTVSYSESRAYKLMRLAEEYGPALSGSEAMSFTKLGTTQAFILLSLPAEERAEFIAEFDLENMANHELKQAVNDRKEVLSEIAVLQELSDTQKNTISQLTGELNQAKQDSTVMQQAVWDEQEKVTQLQRKIDILEDENAAAVHIAELERESKLARVNTSMAQADARLDLITKGLDELFVAIEEMSTSDPLAFKLYMKQAGQLLTKILRRLKRIEKAGPKSPETPASSTGPAE